MMPLLRPIALTALIALLGMVSLDAVSAEELRTAVWPSFQNGGHLSVSGGKLPTKWSADENIAWQADIEGYGQSTPVVSSDQQIIVTSTSGPNKENYHVAAFALASGEKLWQQDFANPSPVENNAYVSRAAPTPILDADGIIAYFEGGVVAALKQDGSVRWQKNLVDEYGKIESRHGLASSLEQTDDAVFVWVERSEEPYLLALKKSDGSPLWKVPGLGSTSWSSPRLIPVDSQEQLVCSSSGKIAGFDPATGERLWDFDQISNNTTCTPMPLGDGRFLIGASDGRGETAAQTDGTSNGVIQIQKDADGKYAAKFAWQAEKAKSSFGSPIAADGHAWFVNRSGVLFGVDLKSGEQTASSRLATGGVWATPLQNDKLLYVFGSKGTTSIIDMTEGDSIAENALWTAEEPAEGERSSGGEIIYSAVAVPPYLLIRTGSRLVAIKEETSK